MSSGECEGGLEGGFEDVFEGVEGLREMVC